MPTISPSELLPHQENGDSLDLIGVQMPTELLSEHVESARFIPLASTGRRAVMTHRNGSADQSLFVIGRSGNGSSQARGKFAEAAS